MSPWRDLLYRAAAFARPTRPNSPSLRTVRLPRSCFLTSELFPHLGAVPSLSADRRSPQLFAAASELLATTSELPRRNLRVAHHNLSHHTIQPSHTHPWTSARGNDIVVTTMPPPRHRCGIDVVSGRPETYQAAIRHITGNNRLAPAAGRTPARSLGLAAQPGRCRNVRSGPVNVEWVRLSRVTVVGTGSWRPGCHLLPGCPRPAPVRAGFGRHDVKLCR